MLALIGMACAVIGITAFGFCAYRGYVEKCRAPENSTAIFRTFVLIGVLSFLLCACLGASVMFGYPQYLVWQQEKEGEAALAKASQDRQIKVQEAEAEREAALSQAEANKTLGESIRSYPEAMEQKWVEAIKETDNQVIYLPTECSIPVTEAGRVAAKARQQ